MGTWISSAAWVVVTVVAMATTAAGQAVSETPVTFESGGKTLAGVLYRPMAAGDEPAPVVVVAPPWLNVKEQVAARHARALAERGVAALAFDYRYWGQSAGEPREWESASAKVEDLRAAVAYLQTRRDVDPQRIGMLGICFGAGHVFRAAGGNDDVKSVATVAAWLHDKPTLSAIFGQEEIDRRYAAAADARRRFEATGEVVYVPAASNTDRTAGMFFPDPSFFYTNPQRGQIPQWTNRMAVMSWDEWLDLDGVAAASAVGQPLLMVHSDASALPDNVRKAFASAGGEKDLLWTQGEHTQFYDSAPHIDKAADALAAHFKRTMAAEQAAR